MSEISWSDFVQSEFVGQALSSKTRHYRDVWTKILERAKVAPVSMVDEKSIAAISATRYFNWAAFFFGPYWAAWRGIRFCWLLVTIAWALALLTEILPATGRFGAEIGLAMTCGFYGTSWYLIKLAASREDRVESLRPSLLRLAIALGGTIACALVFPL
jgi:hypothetical protein